MQISENKVVTIDYTLKDDNGNVLDSSQGGPGLAYLHGASNIIPGLEKALSGKEQGDSLNVSVAPEEAYGERDDSMIQTVPSEMFEGADVQVGAQYQMMVWSSTAITRWRDKPCILMSPFPMCGMPPKKNWPMAMSMARVDISTTEFPAGQIRPGKPGHSCASLIPNFCNEFLPLSLTLGLRLVKLPTLPQLSCHRRLLSPGYRGYH